MKRNLKKILPNNVKPQITYTGRKLGSLFETKDLTISEHKHDAIYHGKCPVENCADDYIGENFLLFISVPHGRKKTLRKFT